MKYSLLGACAVAVCCTAPAFAQGLTRVETIGLQQQLRDDGCGVTHVTGRMDAATRSAVQKCQSKYSGATDARSMLAAMDIGFGNGTPAPTLSAARSGGGGSMSAGGISGSSTDSTGGKVDLNKATPMSPSHAAKSPVPSQGSTNPMGVPTHDTTTTPVDTSSGVAPSKPPLDTIPKRDTIPTRDTVPTMPTMPRRDTMPTMPRRDTMPTMPRRDTMPKRDTMPNSTSPRI
jgi:hypothetical protein